MNVNYSIPVKMFDFKEEKNSLYSTAKLKIFYVGTTEDKRTFTQEFSDKLLKTLPYVPVVGYYNEEDGDFEGHKVEVQYIYGIVPENATIEYIEENSKKYAVSDVILYTGRVDKTGDVAKKIVGKSHSLELNPADTKYKVNKDSKGNFIDLEFTEGSLLGLSVLGDDEKPAFSGSEFFKEEDDSDIEKIFKNLKDFAEKKRGENMRLEKFKEFSQFIKKSYNEQYEDMSKELDSIIGPMHYIDQLFEDQVVVYYIDENYEERVVRIDYSIEDGEYEFGVPVNVIKRYFTEEELKDMTFSEIEEKLISETVVTEVEDEEENFELAESDESGGEETELEDGAAEFVENADEIEAETEAEAIPENAGDVDDGGQEDERDEEVEENDTATLTESEREEFETLKEEIKIYRKRDKEDLIDSFQGHLGKAFLEDLKNRVDEFTLEELDITLAKEFTEVKKENGTRRSSFMPFENKTNSSAQETHDERIRRLVSELK